MTTQTLKQPMSGRASRPSNESAASLVLGYAPNWPIRILVFRVVGAAMVLSASGMWLMPGATTSSDLVLIKLGMSIFFFLCGLALLMRNHQDNQPDAYFDPIRNEVRVLQKDNRGVPEMVLRRSYDTLGSACFNGDMFEMFDPDGTLLMRLPIEDPASRETLRQQLSGKVNLT
ncbi:MAG: hypothetical protein L3J36_01220 [Rhodobacteraceae bacterium]|nr:hypothetical protein [Paracoccaceae bacterium]